MATSKKALAPRIEAILFAEVGRITSEKVTLEGVFDRVNTNADRFSFWVFIRAARLTSPLRVTVTAPGGQVAGSMTIPARHTVQHLAPINLPIQGEGNYLFDVTHEGVSLGVAELLIRRLGH